MKVIIVGGGIAGLTLASALEKAEIDFVLLEARALFDPQVGASIGMQASALRIFDQLGAAQEVIDQTVSFNLSSPRRSDGSLIAEPSPQFQLLEKRFGYSTLFLDRQLVLRALDRTISLRDQMLLNKIVKNIEHDDSGVTVHCEDGSSHRGDVVVGCDGVNSKASVRSEMLRIAGEVDPKAFPASEKTKMTAEYSCLFGISTGVTGLEAGDLDITYDVGRSFLMITGKEGRVFWFFFQKLDKVYTYRADDYPRYSRADAEKVAAENAWRACHGNLTLGDLWNKRLSYTLVPMEEALFNTWSWGRIATLGDSAHKMTANQGQAGNNAVESAAALANHLKKIHDAGTVSSKTITSALRQWQAKRQVRIEATCKEAAEICRMQALDSLKAKFTVFGVLPYAMEFISSQLVSGMIGAEVLEYLPMPERALSGSCPFNPAYGVGHHESTLKRAVFAAPLLLISYWIAKATNLDGGTSFQSNSGLAENWIQSFSPLVDTGLIYAIWLIESNRRANFMTIIQLPIIFSILAQIFGAGVVAPCFYFIHYTFGPLEKFAAADMRLTDLAYTRTILPIVLLGITTAFLSRMASISAGVDDNRWDIIWALLPPVMILMTQWLLVKTGVSKSNVFQDAMTNWNRDLPIIRRTVYVLGAVSGAVWMYGISQGWLSKAFEIGNQSQWNWLGMVLSSAVWLGLLTADLHRAGMIGSISKTTLFESLVVGILAGPVASVAFAWLWREEILASKKEKHAITKEIYAGKSIDTVRGHLPKRTTQNGYAKQNGHAEQNGHTKQNGHLKQKEHTKQNGHLKQNGNA